MLCKFTEEVLSICFEKVQDMGQLSLYLSCARTSSSPGFLTFFSMVLKFDGETSMYRLEAESLPPGFRLTVTSVPRSRLLLWPYRVLLWKRTLGRPDMLSPFWRDAFCMVDLDVMFKVTW